MTIHSVIGSAPHLPYKSRVRRLRRCDIHCSDICVQTRLSEPSVNIGNQEMSLDVSVALQHPRKKVARACEYFLHVAVYKSRSHTSQGEGADRGIVIGIVIS